MAPRNLLRHIFRHGPNPKRDSLRSSEGTSKPLPEVPTATTEDALPAQSHIPPPATSPRRTPEPPVLENIIEETSTDTASTNNTFITEALATLDLDVATFTTRQLLNATIDEIKAAIQSHLDTLEMTLALLSALDGFSPTITEMRKIMVEDEAACKAKIRVMKDVESAVEAMQFGEEEETVTSLTEEP